MITDSKKIAWIFGTVFLGALGSGLWETILKPTSTHIVEFIVDVVFGTFTGIQDYIYKDISSLEREITGRTLLSVILGSISGIVIAICIYSLREPKKEEKAPIPKFIILLYGIFVITFTLFTVGKAGYIIEKQNKYLKLKMIISPYITHKELLLLDSKFALIGNIEQYDKLILEMQNVAIKNNTIKENQKN